MPALPLNEEQLQDAARLRQAWEAFKADHPGATQEKLAADCGWKTQSAVNQYLGGKIPLNLRALLKLCHAMGGIDPSKISPTLAEGLPRNATTRLSPELMERINKASPDDLKLIEIALLQETELEDMPLSPSLKSLIGFVKQQVAEELQRAPSKKNE